ncbi:hypothetical protein DXC28_00930 [Ruminococcus sp. OM08-9BH]|nr:hypothetical protein DXC28_00930 [Ruminococcus sp. OM08-9BH]
MCIGSGWGFVGGWLLGCRESAPLLQSQPEPMHTPRLVIQGGRVGWLSQLGVQVGRFRVAARGLDEASALRWMPGWKG